MFKTKKYSIYTKIKNRMIKTRLIKVKNIDNEEIIMTIIMTKIMTIIIIMVMKMVIKIGNCIRI